MTAPVRLPDAASPEAVMAGLDPVSADADLVPALARAFPGFAFRIARIDDGFARLVFPDAHGHWVEAEIGQAVAAALREQRVRLPPSAPRAAALGGRSYDSEGAPAMDDITPATLVSDLETGGRYSSNALGHPADGARDRLAELLTDNDVATLKHLAREGIGENSLRALASDLAYLEAWAGAATGAALPWPAPESLALKFVAHHLWDPAKREADPQPRHAGRRRGRAARKRMLPAPGRMRRRR